jgi:hypothetical protein
MLHSAADECQCFRKTVFRITVEALCSADMATSNITPHSKAVIPIFNVIIYRLPSVVQQQQQTIQN